jgi:hypothetical protein
MNLRYRLRNSDLAWRRMGDEGTLIDLVNGRVHSCNASSAVVVEKLRSGATLPDLVGALQSTFDVDDGAALEGAKATVDYLKAEGILESEG